jgi:hypothetical protein
VQLEARLAVGFASEHERLADDARNGVERDVDAGAGHRSIEQQIHRARRRLPFLASYRLGRIRD